MEFLKKLAGVIGFLLFLSPCVIAGIYAGKLNTSSTLAGWAVGLGVALIEGCVLGYLGSAKTRNNTLIAAGVMILGLLPSAYFIGWPLLSLGPYKAHMAEYVAMASTGTPDQYPPANNMPVKGKLMPVDMKRKDIDPVFFDLSTELRPKNPEEIGAVAAMWWSERLIGHYGGRGGAYRSECTVMVWDRSSHELLAEKSFTGGEPPSTSRNGASQTGSKPYEEIKNYLNNLPQR